jgi:hypothetical protein
MAKSGEANKCLLEESLRRELPGKRADSLECALPGKHISIPNDRDWIGIDFTGAVKKASKISIASSGCSMLVTRAE